MLSFGTFAPQGWRLEFQGIKGPAAQWQNLRATALHLEELGYDSLWLYDHFHTVPRALIEPTFECWTTMAALAEATSRIRLGQLVTCSLYRNPAYLAKMASCVDVMSGGRVEVGIGAGWKHDEFAAYDYEFPGIRERLERMRETGKVLKTMWTDEKADFQGKYYRVTEAINEPKPLQNGGPPLWIGSQGEKVGLRIVAEVADGWNHNRDRDAFDRKKGLLEQHCRDLGRDPASMRISAERSCAIFDSESHRDAWIRRWWPGSDPAKIAKYLAKECCSGTVEEVVGELSHYVRGGAELVILWFQDLPDTGSGDSMAERFLRDVAPRLREL